MKTGGLIALVSFTLLVAAPLAVAQAPLQQAPNNFNPNQFEVIPPPTLMAPMTNGASPPPPPFVDPGMPPVMAMPPTMLEPPRFWVQTELLIWSISPGPNPTPLATNGSLNDSVPGAFGQPGTTIVLLGGQDINFRSTAGLRLGGGYWFGDAQRLGVEASFLYLAPQTLDQSLVSRHSGNPGFYRPVQDVNFGESSLFVALPSMASGSISVLSSALFLGAELNAQYRLIQRSDWSFNLLAGFRFLDLDEAIRIRTFTNDFAGVLSGPGNAPGTAEVPGSTLAIFDGFHTSNQFYGGQLGFQALYAFASGWFLSGRAQVGLGDTVQTIEICGNTIQNQPGVGMTTAHAGALATASNSGIFVHNAFSVVPQAQLKVGYQFNRLVNAFVGYDFLYWSNVVRPGNQISRSVDFQGIPSSGIYNPATQTAAPPPPSFIQSGFWAQGITLGLQFTF